MGKKGSKRKTRWRTLSIGAPPGEEDEEEGLRNGYVKGQNDSCTHSFDRNGQGDYKPRRTGTGGGSSSYAGGGTRSHKDESSGSPSQPKIIFNEEEYTRITTPRQDMLFKKGYLSRKKPWTGNASTSATPSTTESQSASHSTADGSETTEDQQLLDRDCSSGEYPPVMEPGAQLGYGTFYDHASGYYYEYPVMLVGPAPVPAQVGPNVLAAVPCGPVPLRPIEWINPDFVPKLAGQPYCMMDYECGQSTETVTVVEELEAPLLPAENSNGNCNESGTGSASCSGSVAGEAEEQPPENATTNEPQAHDQPADEPNEEISVEEQPVEEQPLENGVNDAPYLEPMLMQQPMHVSHVIPAVPQPYMYPGHYMFGPPLVNVNGVTIQGGPMIRTMDVAAMTAAFAKRRKKKKRRKQRRLAMGNTEDEEEGEYSSECDNAVPSSRLSWTACSTSTTITTTTSNKPLNPECQEFQLRPLTESSGTSAIPTSSYVTNFEGSSTTSQSSTLSSDATSVDKNNEPCNGAISDDRKSQEDELMTNSTSRSPLKADEPDEKTNRLTNCLVEHEATTQEAESSLSINADKSDNDSSSANETTGRNRVEEQTLVNGKVDSDSNNEDTQITNKEKVSAPSSPVNGKTRSRSGTPKTESLENGESLPNSKPSSALPKRKYSAKGAKFVREPTPGPDLDGSTEADNEKVVAQELNQSLKSMNLSNDSSSKPDSSVTRCDRSDEHVSNTDPGTVDAIEALNEDSGFESQTRSSDYPITDAVTEWLRRANSPDMFVTSTNSVDGKSEDEEEPDEEVQPPKNLQGNPVPALSANSGADNSRATSCSEFARINNIKAQDQLETSRRKSSKRKSRLRRADGRLDNDAVSSSDSCGQQECPVKKRNPTKQQDVGEVCEFTEKDSVAGMRVASSSRMDSKRVNGKRTKRRTAANNADVKIRHIEDVDNENDDDIVDDTMNVKTFEKGEIVVSEDGKLLTTSSGIKSASKSETVMDASKKTEEKNNSSGEEENGNNSLDSIEEPDVLECWEAETIEPVITPKKMLQSKGILCEGEAAEEDNLEAEVHVDYVQKYYRLGRDSVTSVEEETTSSYKENADSFSLKSVPNHSDQTEENPTRKVVMVDTGGPIDEAFEVYESCYTGTAPFMSIGSKAFKSRTLHSQESDGPIPCRAVCCNIQ